MLRFCVASIFENSSYSHQVIIHINEGTDGTLEWVKSMGIDYSYSETNAGICYAMNAMASLATTDYLLYLNDDMYVCKNWDSELLRVATAIPHRMWYLSGTMIEPVTSSSSCVISPFDFGRNPHNFQKEALHAFAAEFKKTDWFGACWPPSLVDKSLFEKVGGYSADFSPGMYSDPDFGMKLWEAGVRHFQGVGSSKVYHFQSHSTGRVKKNDGRRQFAVKWGFTASFFYHSVLKMGTPFNANKKLTFTKNLTYFINHLRSIWMAK